MTKEQALARWAALQPTDPLPHMVPVPYKARGSRYGACGVRIDGNPAFVDAVLSLLKPLLAGEAVGTRLELSRRPVDGSGIGKALPNADGSDAECCYVRLHVRGREGAISEAIVRGARARLAGV